jgi:hypothetical protein
MKPRLTIRVTGQDPDLVGIEVEAQNECFSGTAHTYIGHGELVRLARDLAGFPKARTDLLKVSGGASGGSSWGYFAASFYCYDSVGHTAVRVVLEPKLATYHRAEEIDRLELEIHFEPLQVDIFCEQLRLLTASWMGQATLEGLVR